MAGTGPRRGEICPECWYLTAEDDSFERGRWTPVARVDRDQTDLHWARQGEQKATCGAQLDLTYCWAKSKRLEAAR